MNNKYCEIRFIFFLKVMGLYIAGNSVSNLHIGSKDCNGAYVNKDKVRPTSVLYDWLFNSGQPSGWNKIGNSSFTGSGLHGTSNGQGASYNIGNIDLTNKKLTIEFRFTGTKSGSWGGTSIQLQNEGNTVNRIPRWFQTYPSSSYYFGGSGGISGSDYYIGDGSKYWNTGNTEVHVTGILDLKTGDWSTVEEKDGTVFYSYPGTLDASKLKSTNDSFADQNWNLNAYAPYTYIRRVKFLIE